MTTFIAIIHVIVALLLIALVLLQDSKGGAIGGAFGGGGSNSVLGATGGVNLLVKITRFAAILFAVTCVVLTVLSTRNMTSVVEDFAPAGPAAVVPPPTTPEAPAATPSEAPAPSSPEDQSPNPQE